MTSDDVRFRNDTYGRNTGFSGSSGDSETVGWDTNPLSGFTSYGTNTWGRVSYRLQKNCAGLAPLECVEVYNYTPSGHITGEELSAYNSSGFPVSPQLQASFTYDDEGRMTGITYPALVNASPVSYTYTFDAIGRPAGMSTLASAAYNATDQLTSLAYLGGTEIRTYNGLSQLTGVQLGGLVNTSYFYNAGYNNGQIASSVDNIHGQTVTYSYDSLKRLSAAYYTNVNLLDPGFEQTGVNGWTVSGDATWTDNQYRSWPYSMAISGGSASTGGVCAANATYTASGYYLTASGVSATVTVTGAINTTQTFAPAGSWTYFSFAFTGPASCPGTVSMILGGGEAGGAVYFDDVSLTSPSVSSGANQISNPNFTWLTVAWPTGSGARLTNAVAHSGATSMQTGPANWFSQTVTGLVRNQTYTVSAYLNGGQGTLTVGTGSTTVTASSGWAQISATGQASSTGTLAITALNPGSTGTVYWDDFSMNVQGISQGQQFGYDGFGNLLSQTPISGTGYAPMMNLTVNPSTNQVTTAGTVYDGAGNMTQDGGVTYTYDEMNRLTSTPTLTYSYSPGENKRMAVSGTLNGQPTQLLTLYLYGPNGKVLSSFLYQKSGSTWNPAAGSQTNYFYLGGKAVSYSENNVGSNAAAAFWPYGGQNAGTGVFGTYLLDWSGFYYADQRYYNQNWGRFVTADPSDANVDSANSGSFNRYAYVNGDPANGSDPHGRNLVCDEYACWDDGQGAYGGDPGTPTFGNPPVGPPADLPSPDSSDIGGGLGSDSTSTGAPGTSIGVTIPANASPSDRATYCARLAQKIANLTQELLNSAWNLESNPSSLPIDLPGAPNITTQWGHVKIYSKYQDDLANALKNWSQNCSSEPPPSVPPTVIPTAPSTFTIPNWLKYVGIGSAVIGGAACAAAFEICAPAAAFAAAF